MRKAEVWADPTWCRQRLAGNRGALSCFLGPFLGSGPYTLGEGLRGSLMDVNWEVSVCPSVLWFEMELVGLSQPAFSQEKIVAQISSATPHSVCSCCLLLLLFFILTSSWIVVSDSPTGEGPKLNVTSPGFSVISASWL